MTVLLRYICKKASETIYIDPINPSVCVLQQLLPFKKKYIVLCFFFLLSSFLDNKLMRQCCGLGSAAESICKYILSCRAHHFKRHSLPPPRYSLAPPSGSPPQTQQILQAPPAQMTGLHPFAPVLYCTDKRQHIFIKRFKG